MMCWILAPALVVTFTALGLALHGSTGQGAATFQRGDSFAMIGLGVLGAAIVLLFTRVRVEADANGVRVRNVLGSYNLPWEVVRAVRFDRGSPWASLELHDDELIPMIAVQAVDKDSAVVGVRALRALHQSAQPVPAAS
ncbi:PH domain-containing protein [Micromonospora sp. NPDC050397]|uniref:PH domain-containing protein n=1 Tax=Micromonospora sp. NPDC050397 TaxID=3364279 RepID=UPI00384EE7FB